MIPASTLVFALLTVSAATAQVSDPTWTRPVKSPLVFPVLSGRTSAPGSPWREDPTRRGIFWQYGGTGIYVRRLGVGLNTGSSPDEIRRRASFRQVSVNVREQNAWLLSEPVHPPAGIRDNLLQVDTKADTTGSLRLYWMEKEQEPAPERSVLVQVPASDKMTSQVVDLSASGSWRGAERFKMELVEPPGENFSLRTEFLKPPDAAWEPTWEAFP